MAGAVDLRGLRVDRERDDARQGLRLSPVRQPAGVHRHPYRRETGAAGPQSEISMTNALMALFVLAGLGLAVRELWLDWREWRRKR